MSKTETVTDYAQERHRKLMGGFDRANRRRKNGNPKAEHMLTVLAEAAEMFRDASVPWVDLMFRSMLLVQTAYQVDVHPDGRLEQLINEKFAEIEQALRKGAA